MAEKQIIGGYQCEFVGPVPEELLCKECKLVARKPHTIDCCEVRFCHACIDSVLKDKKPCPNCSEAEFLTFFSKAGQRKILALQVHCSMKQKGCEWVGQLEQLDAHLDTDCQYVDVECPSKCDQKVQKRKLATHLKENCPKREFMCPYCNFTANFEIISNVHWPECLLFPLKCPNRCGVTCEREFIEDHMQNCSLEEVKCEVSFAGCNEKFLREDQDKHMELNTQKHIMLMATATVRTSREFEQKLQEKECEMKEMLAEKDQQIRELQESHKHVQQKLEENMRAVEEKFQKELEVRDQQIKRCNFEVTALKMQCNEQSNKLNIVACIPPYVLTVQNIQEIVAKAKERKDKQRKKVVYPYISVSDILESPSHSERFHTHPKGYLFCVSIWAYGRYHSKGSYVSVLVEMIREKKDPKPREAVINFTLQLLNQHRDQDHVTVTSSFEYKENEAESAEFNTLILHTALGWNPEKKTQYLKDNCLRFRISNINVKTI